MENRALVGGREMKEFIARILKRIGVGPHYSIGIHGGLTLGYGRLDNNGFWQYPLRVAFLSKEKEGKENDG